MIESDAIEIVMRIKAHCPKWFVDEFTHSEWVKKFEEIATDDDTFVWGIVEVELSKQTDGYPPALGRLRLAVGTALGDIAREKRQALPAPEEEPKASDETAAKYSAEITAKLATAAKSYDVKAAPKYGFERVQPMTSDDLETGGKE